MPMVIEAPAHEGADLIPVRMCNEFVYCPRLFHLEHVQGTFMHSADTIEGAGQHERAKRRGNRLRVAVPDATGHTAVDDVFAALPRKLQLASEQLGVRGTIDLVEVDEDGVVVVEAKHGKAPRTDQHAWEGHPLPYQAWPADVAQVALYMALLREANIACDEARILYRGSRRSTRIPWTADLERFAHAVVARAREVAVHPVPPPPLVDSPKCPGCSMHEVCLPDEHNALLAEREREREAKRGGIRKIVASLDEGSVIHVMTPGTTVRKDGDALVIADREGALERILAKDVSHLALFGPVHVTNPCLQHMLRSGIGVSHHTSTGRLLGLTAPLCTRNIGLRRAQYRAADDPSSCLAIARALVIAKLRNQRTVLRRHRRGLSLVTDELDAGTEGASPDPSASEDMQDPRSQDDAAQPDAHRTIADALRRIRIAIDAAQRCGDIDALRGHEGDAAACYFATFPMLLPPAWQADFSGRSRRPPRDRVNAMLSFGYSLLTRDAVSAAARVGLDPMLGLFHTMIPGRPALALDLIEPFRAAWVDTAVLRLVGTGGIARDDFHVSAAGVELSDRGRRKFVRAYERRAAELTTHPRFGYRMSYRRLLELEARILAKVLLGELEEHTPMWTR